MSTQYIYKQLSRLWILIVFISLPIFFMSCGKDEPTPEPEEETPDPEPQPVDEGVFYKLIRVENFQGDTTANYTGTDAQFFYSLEQNVARTGNYQKTSRWDMAFGSLYACFISGNNGENSLNFGYRTQAKGGVLLVEKSFEEVVEIPSEDEFKTGKNVYGLDIEGDYGAGLGWLFYDFGGEFVRDGAYDNAHIAYALGDISLKLNSGKTLSPRTLIIRTANGHYAKVNMISVYKDAYTQDKWFRKTPHMYYTFEYIIVPKGSLKFEIKK